MSDGFRIVVGIDPGASGGVAWNAPGAGIKAVAMPNTEAETVELLREINLQAGTIKPRVYIELVTGFVKIDKDEEERENRQPGHTMFKFGRGTGIITGALLAMGITPIEVAPRTWQKPFFIARGTKATRKRALKDAAQRKYPQIKVTLKNCDALLIRAYGEMLERSTSPAIASEPQSALVTGREAQRPQGGTASKEGGDAKPFSPDFDTIKAKVSQAGDLEVHEWHGENWLFKTLVDGKMQIVRKASPADLINYPFK